jgi:hypothetical protein
LLIFNFCSLRNPYGKLGRWGEGGAKKTKPEKAQERGRGEGVLRFEKFYGRYVTRNSGRTWFVDHKLEDTATAD